MFKNFNIFFWIVTLNCVVIPVAPQAIEQALNLLANTVDVFCSTTIPLHNAFNRDKPDISKMNFIHMTACRNYTVPLMEANKLSKYKKLDMNKKIVILATGWQNTVNNSNTLNRMWNAFQCRDDINFLFADVASYMDSNYKTAALNTVEVGKSIAIGLKNLIQIVPLRNIHLIGHSLGAHTVGVAGRYFTTITNGLRIPRITGLDPAKPCFTGFDHLYSLNRHDATLIDVIHTNNNILGLGMPIGHIDFYPGGAISQQPGCNTVECSHSRAVDYFIESIHPKHEKDFPAYYCRTVYDLNTLNCSARAKKLHMGYRLGNGSYGIYFINVNDKSPFGENGIPVKTKVCRRCRR